MWYLCRTLGSSDSSLSLTDTQFSETQSVLLENTCSCRDSPEACEMNDLADALYSHSVFVCFFGLAVENPPTNAGDIRGVSLIPGSGRSPGGGHGNPPHCSCRENPRPRSLAGYSPRGRKESDLACLLFSKECY